MENLATTFSQEKEKTTSPEEKAITNQNSIGESTSPEDQKVVELKSEVDTLKKQLEQAKILQSQADKKARMEKLERLKIEKELKRIQSGEIPTFSVETEETPIEIEERFKARIGIQNLFLANPEYQELLKQDITLREVIKNNPFAIVSDWIDSEDAIAQMKDYLDSRISSLSQPSKEEKKEEIKKVEVGAIQPPESVPLETITSQKEALKKGDIASSIRAKITVEE